MGLQHLSKQCLLLSRTINVHIDSGVLVQQSWLHNLQKCGTRLIRREYILLMHNYNLALMVGTRVPQLFNFGTLNGGPSVVENPVVENHN